MEKERKTVFLTAFSLLMYGLVSVLGHGPFAFFPINEIAFCIITIYFGISHYKFNKVSYSILIAYSIISLPTNQLFLSFFMHSEKMVSFCKSNSYEIIRWITHLLILSEIVHFYQKTAWKFQVYSLPISLCFWISGFYWKIYSFQVLGLLVFLGILYLYYKKTANDSEKYSKSLFYLWYFLIFLKLSSLFTMYLYDYSFD
jgi:hypothetical protein